jgi:Uma2 family endonuclease
MAFPQPAYVISEEEYLTGEQESTIRHEYVNGQVYAMAEASDKHNLIAVNMSSLLNTQLPDHCEVFIADMKVRIQTKQDIIFYYPDVMVSCAEDDQATYYREGPCLIIEVLSQSTERQDRFEKFWTYQQIPTLQDYLLLAQDRQHATLFRRSNEWQPEAYREGTFHLTSVNLDISLDALYRRVRFD